MTVLEKAADELGLVGGRRDQIAALIQAPPVHRRQQRRIPALGDQARRPRPPQAEVVGQRHLDERLR
jgi:hypothetical protein